MNRIRVFYYWERQGQGEQDFKRFHRLNRIKPLSTAADEQDKKYFISGKDIDRVFRNLRDFIG
jgi:hypothetical protein